MVESGLAETEGYDNSSFETYQLGFNVSWEADVWGRFTRQIESASAVLLGQPPQSMNVLLTTPGPIPSVQPRIAVDMPQDLIPDDTRQEMLERSKYWDKTFRE